MTLDGVTAVVPAAGRSTRFGAMKLLADVDGRQLIERTICALLDAGVQRVVVVTRDPAAFSGVPVLHDRRVATIVNGDPERGMFSSIQAGLAASTGDVVLVLPADMPFVAAATVAAVAARALETGSVVVPVHRARRGHPIAVPGALRAALLACAPTTTLKDALAVSAAAIVALEVADAGILRDVDVPGDLGG
jgi:molybdenum cofactor cytidylyltransferase